MRNLSLPLLAATALIVAMGLPRPTAACTTVLLEHEGRRLMAKSYDWDNGRGLLLHNKRGVAKRALLLDPAAVPANWTSAHASLTFNQYGRELPNGGINDAGLVVEIMWLKGSIYPPRDPRPALNELQWIQYQLDRFARTAEVVAHAPSLRVAPVRGRVHYLVCDGTGDCAAMEYLDGELVVHGGTRLPFKALTNHPYAEARRRAEAHAGLGGKAAVPTGRSSHARFVRAALAARRPPVVRGRDLLATTFAILDDVAQGDRTRWQIVYDLSARSVHFRTRDARAIKTLRLADLPPDCRTPVQMLSMDSARGGDVKARLLPFDGAANRALIDHGMKRLGGAMGRLVGTIAAYPQTTRCALKAAPVGR